MAENACVPDRTCTHTDVGGNWYSKPVMIVPLINAEENMQSIQIHQP